MRLNDEDKGKKEMGAKLQDLLLQMSAGVSVESALADRYVAQANQHYNQWCEYFKMFLEANHKVEPASTLATEAANAAARMMEEIGEQYKAAYETEMKRREAEKKS